MFPSAHVDTFTRDNLPPAGQWPTLLLLSAVWAAVMLVVHGFAGMYRLRARQIG